MNSPLCTAALTSAALILTLAPSAGAADLYVAGTVGEVYRGDTEAGGFAQFGGICLGPVQALAMDDTHVYAGDLVGGIVSFNLGTGAFDNVFFVQQAVTAMVTDMPHLLVSHGDTSGTIKRVDPAADGQVLATLTAGFPVGAMLLLGDELFVATDFAGVWRGNPVTGDFVYFGCGCSGPIVGLAADDDFIYAADEFGQIVLYDRTEGFLWGGYFLPVNLTDITLAGDVLLASDTQQIVHRLDPVTGVEIDTMSSPIAIATMLVTTACLGDADGDGDVDVDDLNAVFLDWGTDGSANAGDVDGSGLVDVNDLVAVFTGWGVCS